MASQLGSVLRDRQLLRLDLGIFSLHVMMTAIFLVVPHAIVDAGVAADDHWTVYLPVLVGSLALMVPFVIQAEGRGRAKPIFLGGIATLAAVSLGFAMGAGDLVPLLVLLLAFFTAVNLLEALLPSFVSKTCPAGAKGTAMGVYSSLPVPGGLRRRCPWRGGPPGLRGLGGLLGRRPGCAGVVGRGRDHDTPERVTSQVLALGPSLGGLDVLGIQRQLLAVPGVRDAVVVPEEGVAYLKVDSQELDSARLTAFSA